MRAVVSGGRLLVTVGLLVALARRVDFGNAGSLLAGASMPYLAAAVTMLFAAAAVGVFRWHAILAAQGPSPGICALLKLVLTGLFFNQVLPTGIGGDAVRAWRCRDYGVDLARAVRSVLLDRVSGYVIIVALYAVSLTPLLRGLPDTDQRDAVLALFVLSLAPVAAIGAAEFLPGWMRRLPGFGAVAEFSREARALSASPQRACIIFGVSGVATVLTAMGCMLVGQSVGAEVSLGQWLMIIAPLTVLQLLPVSLAGWGVREIGLVAALPMFGVTSEAALAISLLIGLCLVATGLPGSVIWLARLDLPRTKPVSIAGSTTP